MTQLKLLSSALLAAAVIATPAMAREHHVVRHSVDDAYASMGAADAYAAAPDAYAAAPDVAYAAAPYPAYAGYGYRGYGYGCVPAPRVGSFAGDPWTNDVPCVPGSGPGY